MATLRDSVTAEVKRQKAERLPFHTPRCYCFVVLVASIAGRDRSRTNNQYQMPSTDEFNYHPDILDEDDEDERLTARGPRPRLTLQADADFLKVFKFLEVAEGRTSTNSGST